MSRAQPDEGFTPNAGGSTDQHITGSRETGTFLTDEPPTADTPADGSTNAGLNTAGGRTVVPGDRGEDAASGDVPDGREPPD